MAKSTTPKAAGPDADRDGDLLLEMSDFEDKLNDAGEAALREIASQCVENPSVFGAKQQLSAIIEARHDRVFRRLGFDEARVAREISRMWNVLAEKRKAGTSAELQSAEERVKMADAERAEKLPQLQSQIAELQREIARVETAGRDAAAAVERMRNARKRLVDLAPEHILREHKFRKASLMANGRQARAPIYARTCEIAALLAHNVDSSTNTADFCSRLPAEHPARARFTPTSEGSRVGEYRFDEQAFLECQEKARVELPELQEQLLKIDAELRDAEAEADEILEFYIPD
ncbi:MAG TPA: hypothetical protein VGJ26_11290 [Pirellulales bacterium]